MRPKKTALQTGDLAYGAVTVKQEQDDGGPLLPPIRGKRAANGLVKTEHEVKLAPGREVMAARPSSYSRALPKMERGLDIKPSFDQLHHTHAGPSQSVGPLVAQDVSSIRRQRMLQSRGEERAPLTAERYLDVKPSFNEPYHSYTQAGSSQYSSTPLVNHYDTVKHYDTVNHYDTAHIGRPEIPTTYEEYFEEEPEVPKKKRARKADAGPPEEKRLARFRATCPKNIMDRVHRVRSQRMFLVDRQKLVPDVPMEQFKVLGSTGNVYTVIISFKPQCDCPDCLKGNVPCKHILFVFLKVLKVPEDHYLWYQKGLLTNELESIFASAPGPGAGSETVSADLRQAYLQASGQAGPTTGAVAKAGGNKKMDAIGEDCPVCYDEMSEADEKRGRLIFDESIAGCGKPLHKECFDQWVATSTRKGDTVTCVWCRTPWPTAGLKATKGKGRFGGSQPSSAYMNMADVVGISRKRDTSSYYWGPMRGRSMYESRCDDY